MPSIPWVFTSIPSRLVNGLPVADPSGPNMLTQWMDTPLADAWITEANRLISSPQTNADWIGQVTNAIANAYNAMNVPWYQDPVARQLWRTYLAGPPEDETSEFAPDRNWNRNWYKANAAYPQTEATYGPGIPSGAHTGRFSGEIPRKAQESADSNGIQRSHPIEFRQMAGVYLDTQDPEAGAEREDIRTTKYRINHGFSYPSLTNALLPLPPASASMVPAGINGDHYAAIDALYCDPAPPAVNVVGVFSLNTQIAQDRCRLADPWNTFRYIRPANAAGVEYNPHVPVPVWPPLNTYLPWLRAWVAALVNRRPYQIVLDARRFAITQTMAAVNASQNLQNYLASVQLARQQTFSDEHRQNQVLQVAAAIAATLGTAVGTVTGGVGTVVGALVAATLLVIDAANIESITGHGKDDLGAYKPTLDWGWLDGDPVDSSPRGAPSSRLVIPNPPGWNRPAPGTLLFIPPVLISFPTSDPARATLAGRLGLPGQNILPSTLTADQVTAYLALPDNQMRAQFQAEFCQLPPGGLTTQLAVDSWNRDHQWCVPQKLSSGMKWVWFGLGAAGLYAGYRWWQQKKR